MKKYRFFDTDSTGHLEFDISGTAYSTFLKTCFKYCASVSVVVSPALENDISSWDAFRIPLTEAVKISNGDYAIGEKSNDGYVWKTFETRHYRLSMDIKKMILDRTDSIFKWTHFWGNDNPDDICFYRADGSILFSSVIHEGECTLFIRDDEDFSEVLTQSSWIPMLD